MKYLVTHGQFEAEIDAPNPDDARDTALLWSYPWRRVAPLDVACLSVRTKEAPADLSRCVWCGSDEFLADTTDTWTASLDKDGKVHELHKSYPGDVHNVNCAKCGAPAQTRADYE